MKIKCGHLARPDSQLLLQTTKRNHVWIKFSVGNVTVLGSFLDRRRPSPPSLRHVASLGWILLQRKDITLIVDKSHFNIQAAWESVSMRARVIIVREK